MMVRKLAPDSTRIDPEKLAAWLEQHWKDKRCPICKSNSWSISEKAWQLREWHNSSLHIPSFQVVALLQCLVCGNTIFINPFIADLFKDKKETFSTVPMQATQT